MILHEIQTLNILCVYYVITDEVKQSDLLTAVDNIKTGRTAESQLFQVLVD